jgi:hypothetical protein
MSKEKMQDGSIVETKVNKTFTRITRTLNGIFVDFPDGTPAIRKLVDNKVVDYSSYPAPDASGRRNVVEVFSNKDGTQYRKSVYLYGSQLYETQYEFLNECGISIRKDIYIECDNDWSRIYERTYKYDDGRMRSYQEFKNPYDHDNPSRRIDYAQDGDITYDYTETWHDDVCNTLQIDNNLPYTKIEKEFVLKDGKYFRKWIKEYECPNYKDEKVYELKHEQHYDFTESGEHYLRNEKAYSVGLICMKLNTVIRNGQKITTTNKYRYDGSIIETRFEVNKKNGSYVKTTYGKTECVCCNGKNGSFERETVDGVLTKYIRKTPNKIEEIYGSADEVSQQITKKSENKTSIFSRKISRNGTSENAYVKRFKDGFTYTEEHNRLYDADGKIIKRKDSFEKVDGNEFNAPFGTLYSGHLPWSDSPVTSGYIVHSPFSYISNND